MKEFLNQIKLANRQRIENRRQKKYKDLFNNYFDRSSLRIESLTKLVSQRTPLSNPPKSGIAIYSTYFGPGQLSTFNNQFVDPNIDHYFISNNLEILSQVQKKGWMGIHIDLPISQNRILSAQQSKIPKALPHIFEELHRYSFLFYKDDKIEFNPSLLSGFVEKMTTANAAMMMRLHPDLKSNVLMEFATSMHQKRYEAQRGQMIEYISEQLDQGYSLRVEKMFWTSAILRDMKHPMTTRINEDWYAQILTCGIECQLSFDFVSQKFDCIAEMPQAIA